MFAPEKLPFHPKRKPEKVFQSHPFSGAKTFNFGGVELFDWNMFSKTSEMQMDQATVSVSVRLVCCVLEVLCFALHMTSYPWPTHHKKPKVSGAEILYDNLDDQEQVVVNCPIGFSGSLDLTCQKGVILTEGHLGKKIRSTFIFRGFCRKEVRFVAEVCYLSINDRQLLTII